MWKKLKALLAEMESIDYDALSEEEKEKIKERLLTEISFFQHERLVHLIVTVLFALLTIAGLFLMNMTCSIGYALLEALFICLLIPYIVHYYRLENGVQKLYTFYEKLQ